MIEIIITCQTCIHSGYDRNVKQFICKESGREVHFYSPPCKRWEYFHPKLLKQPQQLTLFQ